jgi:hypothetical protein
MRQRAETTTRGAASSSLRAAEGLGHPTPDLFPFGVLCAPLYGLLLFFVPKTGGENTTLRLRGACGASLFVAPVVSPRGERPVPRIACQAFY